MKFYYTLGCIILPVTLIAACTASGPKKTTSINTDVAVIKQQDKIEMVMPEAEKFPLTQAITAPIITRPAKRIYQFGFDQQGLNQQEQLSLEQHAEYLIANPDTVLVINGHSDTQGNREYNKFLSKERAKKIAEFFINYGIAESQLTINGLGDSQPLNDVDNFRENRRVELEYNDSRVATK